MPNNETIIMAMEYDLRKLLEKPEYRGIMISNDEFYNTEIWDLNRILEEYQKHPYHVEKVKTYMHAVRSASIAVDYEF